jgi:hypothetical protein
LQHALRGILAAGGNIDGEWTMKRTLSAGDDAAGVPVLKELYEQMNDDVSRRGSSLETPRNSLVLRGRCHVR